VTKNRTKRFRVFIRRDKITHSEGSDIAVVQVPPLEPGDRNCGCNGIADRILEKIGLVVNPLVADRCHGRAVIEYDLKSEVLCPKLL